MIDDGADFIDVGGESTRPGAIKVYPTEEILRVLPTLQSLDHENINISLDTRNSETMELGILSGVKTYGTLAEFGLGALLKDLLPASQFIANAKMKDDTSETVEFAIKLQDVLLPIDSHWPVEKYKAIDDAYNANNKEAQGKLSLASSVENLFMKFGANHEKTINSAFNVLKDKLKLRGRKKFVVISGIFSDIYADAIQIRFMD